MIKRTFGMSLVVGIAAFAAGLSFAQVTAQTGRTPQFENTDVKVWKSVILPHSPLPLHRHDHPRVIIALEGGTMNVLQKDGAPEIHEWKSGHAYWLPANAPGTMHQDVNMGDKPIVVMVVELEKSRAAQ